MWNTSLTCILCAVQSIVFFYFHYKIREDSQIIIQHRIIMYRYFHFHLTQLYISYITIVPLIALFLDFQNKCKVVQLKTLSILWWSRFLLADLYRTISKRSLHKHAIQTCKPMGREMCYIKYKYIHEKI